MKQAHRKLLTGISLLSTLWLSACTIFPEAESLKIYQLPAPDMTVASGDPVPFTLRISTPRAGSVLSSPRMVVNPRGNELQNYKGARWTDPAPALLRDHLAQAFEQRGAFTAVSTDENAFSADIHMSSDLRRFQVIYGDSGPYALIELNARLIDPTSRNIIAGKTFITQQPLASEAVPGVVSAFKKASDDLAARLIDWTASELSGRAVSP
jgi:cholesterol transport system auxiliary component